MKDIFDLSLCHSLSQLRNYYVKAFLITSPELQSLLSSAIRFVSLIKMYSVDNVVCIWLFINSDGLSFSLQLFLFHICSTPALQSHNGVNILLRCFSGTLPNRWQRRSSKPPQIRTIISVICRKQLKKIENWSCLKWLQISGSCTKRK